MSTLLATARRRLGLLPRPLASRPSAPSKGCAATAVDSPRAAPVRPSAIVRPVRDRAEEERTSSALQLQARRVLALGPAVVAGTAKAVRSTPASVLPPSVGAKASDGDHLKKTSG